MSELPAWDLTSKEETPTQRMISVYQKLQSDSGLGPDEAFEQALQTVRQEGLLTKPTKETKRSKLKETKPVQEEPPPSVDIKNIFNT